MAKFKYSEYGVNKREWHKIREKIIFHRARLRCEACGVLSQMAYIWSEFKQVSLPLKRQYFEESQYTPKHVHIAQMHLAHIDDKKKNMNEENLLCLCACCHDLFDRRKTNIRLDLLENIITIGIINFGKLTINIKHLGNYEFEYTVTKNEE